MILASFLLMCSTGQTVPLQNVIPVKIVGPWTIQVGPGTIHVGAKEVALTEAVTFEITPAPVIAVKSEKHDTLPVFSAQAAGWCKGARLKALIAEGCTGTGLLFPETVQFKTAADGGTVLKRGVDYEIDPFWATFGRVEGGAIAADQPVFTDYTYSPCKLDSILVDAHGKARLAAGKPEIASALPPEPAPGETAVANIYVAGRIERLSDENLFPIEFSAPPAKSNGEQAERYLPKTLAKLRAGQPVTIVAFGDSVTCGGGVGSDKTLWYQYQFEAQLKKRFPKAGIKMLTAGWDGHSSDGYMQAPKGDPHDFERDVLSPKPDLVTIEFVNDAYLDEAATQVHYAKIMEYLHGIGAEVILITPHLVRPDWLNSNTLKFDEDPRPYVKGLRRFAAENHLALADASKEWCRFWRQGIPYVTIEANAINHPDVRGHALFARVLMDVFPES